MRELLPILAVLAMAATAYSGTYQIECPPSGQSDEVVHIPHEYDCAKFYKCVNGEKQLQTCKEYSGNRKLYFNPEIQVCDWPWNVTCTLREPKCPEGSDEDIKLSHPYDCSLYYQCKNGKTIEKCPKGQHFDSVRMACTKKEEATCYLFWDTCPPLNFHVDARYPHQSSCNKYYECIDEVMTAKQCPKGEGFDINLKKCVPAKEATCDPALKPVESNDCPPTGLDVLPHETQCGLYYECKDGVKTEKECLGGLSFDPEKHICGWPPSTMCSSNVDPASQQCPQDGSSEFKRIPHECFCNQYYECYKGNMYQMYCEDGNEFDYIRQVCDKPDKVTCINSEKLFEARDERCPVNGTMLIPHESDVKYYYVCKDGRKFPGKCLEGHCFNQNIGSCDFDNGSNCKNGLPWFTTPRSIEPDECPKCDCGINNYPHPRNCSMFIRCENGTKHVMECPDGLQFNPVTQLCDWPDNVNCSTPITCEKGNKTHHECDCQKYYECDGTGWIVKWCENGTKYDFPSNTCKPDKEAQCYPPKNTTGCNGQCPETGHKIIVEDCQHYCECNNGAGNYVNCSKDMYYNPDKQMCDWPENVRNMSCEPFPCPTNATEIKVPHDCSCDLYYICDHGKLTRQECPKGTEYNYETAVCVKYDDAHCYETPKPDIDIDSQSCIGVCPKLDISDRSATLPHKNCTKYCRCGAGAPYVVHCAPGLHFNEITRTCTNPKDANCNQAAMYGFDEHDSKMSPKKDSYWGNILPEFF